MAYSITKHELLDIRILITRSVAYGVVSTLLITSFILLNLQPLPIILAAAANAALGLFWAFAAHRLRAFIQTPLEEKWITDSYDSDKLVNNIAQKLIPIVERDAVFTVIAAELSSAVKIKSIEILPRKIEGGSPELTRTGNGLVIPLSSSDGIEGTLTLGEKVSEDPYTEKDLTVLRTIMIQARAIFDRVRPYEQIKRDYEQAEAQLERAQRLSSLGRIIAEVAHEINNPLAVVSSRSEKLLRKPDDPAFVRESAELLVRKCEQIVKIVRLMRNFAAPPKPNLERVDVVEAIRSALRFIPTRSNIEVKDELQPIPAVMGDRDELERVFINLLTNAYDALAEQGGRLTVRSAKDNDGQVRIEVADTGPGIKPEELPKIFDPFYTTKFGQIEGRIGFGLAICHNIIVGKLGGTIVAESKQGSGTKFTITLPVGQDSHASPASA